MRTLIKEAIVVSFDDPQGLRQMIDPLLSSPLQTIAVAYGSSNRDDYSFLEDVKDARVIKIREKERRGKIAAINSCLDFLHGDIIYLISSDITFDSRVISQIESHFSTEVGVVFPDVVPVERSGLISRTGALLWQIRSASLKNIEDQGGIPHGGEMIAFRRDLLSRLPDVVNDEEYICMLAASEGMKVVYADDVRIKNLTADNVRDYIRQRSRIIYGHRQMWSLGFQPQIMDFLLLSDPILFFRNIYQALRKRSDLGAYMLPLLFLETVSLLESYRYGMRKNVLIWKLAMSTKPSSGWKR
ncbi:MAG: glycosyltransferase [Candidatus Thermoplasmatota archaeon]|nr:glycosyltransferase [Candidatus Thermoplasmatota archaeon]